MRRNFLLKYEHRIKDKELHDKEQKIYTDLIFIRFKRTFTNNFAKAVISRCSVKKNVLENVAKFTGKQGKHLFLLPFCMNLRRSCKKVEEISIKCKKFSTTQGFLRNAI